MGNVCRGKEGSGRSLFVCLITSVQQRKLFPPGKYFNFLFTPPYLLLIMCNEKGLRVPSGWRWGAKKQKLPSAAPHVDDNARSFSSPRSSWILYLNQVSVKFQLKYLHRVRWVRWCCFHILVIVVGQERRSQPVFTRDGVMLVIQHVQQGLTGAVAHSGWMAGSGSGTWK